MAVIGSVSGLNVAQQQVALALNASQSEVLWMINIYAITMAALLLPLGAVGDRWGRKPVLLAGLVVFGVASAAAGLAPSSEVMLAARFPDVAVLLKSMQRLGYLPRLQDVPFAVVAHIRSCLRLPHADSSLPGGDGTRSAQVVLGAAPAARAPVARVDGRSAGSDR